MGLLDLLNAIDNNDNNDRELASWEIDEKKKNGYDSFNFEEEELEDDDYYSDDDIDN